MPSNLDQIIVDAETLKEAAIKSAQSEIVEQYSADVKKAVDLLMEQLPGGPPPGPTLPAEAMPQAGPPMETPFSQQVKPSYTNGDDLCKCPEEGEQIVINFDQLQAQIQKKEGDRGGSAEDLVDRDEMAGQEIMFEDVMLQDILSELEVDTQDLKNMINENNNIENTLIEKQPEQPQRALVLENIAKEREDLAYEAEDRALLQETKQNNNNKLLQEQKILLTEQQNKISILQEAQKKQLKENKILKEQSEKYKRLLLEMKDKVEEVNLSNAKLYYKNSVLSNDSMNGRQRDRIVEAVLKANTVEEAKIIFETLQSAAAGVSSASKRKTPKSLNEVVSKRSSAFLPRKEEKQFDPNKERMQKLAGIKT